MQIFWNAGANVFYEARPLGACCGLPLVNRDQRLEDSPVNRIIHQEYLATEPQPSIEFGHARPNALPIEKVEQPGSVDAIERSIGKVQVLGKFSQATDQFGRILRRRSRSYNAQLPGIDFIGKHLPGASFERLDDDVAIAGSDLQQDAFRLFGKIKIRLCDLINIEIAP